MTRSRPQPRPLPTERAVWRLLGGAEEIAEQIACLAIWGIVALLFFQMFFRYALSTGLAWPEELARYLHIVVVFLALGATTRRHAHIRIDLLARRLQSRALDRAVLIVELAAAVVLAAGAAEIVRRLGAFRTPALGMSLALFFLPTAIGFASMAAEHVRQLLAGRDGADGPEQGPAGVHAA